MLKKMLKKPNAGETLLEYYNREATDKNLNVIIRIVDSICVEHYPDFDENFEKQVVEFTEKLKTDNEMFYIKNLDALVFRIYGEIIEKNLEKRQREIKASLSEQEIKTAKEFAERVYSLKKLLFCIASVGHRPYTREILFPDDIEEIAEFVIHTGAGIVIFHFDENKQDYVFGFTYKNNVFEEIDARKLLILSQNNKKSIFTTYSELNSKQQR